MSNIVSLTRTDSGVRGRTTGGSLRRGLIAGAAVALLAAPAGGALAQLSTAPGSAGQAAVSPLNLADLVERVKPSVVSISVSSEGVAVARNDRGNRDGRGQGRSARPFPELPEDHPLNEFFRNLPPEFRGGPGGPGSPGTPGPQRPRLGQGSGFVISPDGFVVTNNHVIDGASKITVSFDDKTKQEAELIGTDARTDLALLKIKGASNLPFVKFASKAPRVGDWVVAVGNPFGLGGTVTAGIVSAMGRDIGSGPYDYMQIDAAVNRGNSGGPTFNLEGDVVGVNTAIYSPSGGNVGIAFAVPAATAVEVIDQLKKSGSVQRGWLGVRIQNIDDDVAASLGLPKAGGALVNDVTADGPAATAGVRSQDAILALNGQEVADSRDLARKVAEFAPGTTVELKVRRANRDETIRVTLGTFPQSGQVAARVEPGKPTPTELDDLGLGVVPLPADGLPGDPSVKNGVVVSEVDNGSDAAAKGLKTGDVVLQVNGTAVNTPAEVAAAVKKAKELKRPAVLLTVRSSNQQRVVAVQLKKEG